MVTCGKYPGLDRSAATLADTARAVCQHTNLHGEGDTVIPATETLWLAQDVPAERLRTALVSPAIEHVELKSPSAADKWALVHFMGQIIGEAESSR